MVIKLQTWEPDTCDSPACQIVQRFDTDNPGVGPVIVGYERVCPAHAATYPVGKMLWADGNWKNTTAYQQYQRNWFLWRNHQQWLIDHPSEPMPPSVVPWANEPTTPGSVTAPSGAELSGKGQIDGWVAGHNGRKNLTISAGESVRPGLDRSRITWSWTGAGDTRVLTVNFGGQLTTAQRNQLQSLVDTQFGTGKVVIVA